MTDASSDAFTKPTPALVGSGVSAVQQSISTDQVAPPTCAEPTPLDAYNSSNSEDPAGTRFLNLIRAHHAMGRRNTERLAVSMQALAAVKTPTEFVELQHKLLSKTLATVVSDGKTIAKLTTDAFTAAFNPLRKKVGDLRSGAKRQE
jgi:hypothetical protein